jgi:hypothetical protein
METLFFSSYPIAGKLLKSTQTPQPAQSSRINNIEHIIPLVNYQAKIGLYVESKQLPT